MTAARSPQWQLLTLVLLLLDRAAPLHATHSGPSEPMVVHRDLSACRIRNEITEDTKTQRHQENTI